MEKVIVTATQARKSFFSLLDKAAEGKAEVVVVKSDTEKAISFVPVAKPKNSSWKEFKKTVEGVYGIIKNGKDWEEKKTKLSKKWSYKVSQSKWK